MDLTDDRLLVSEIDRCQLISWPPGIGDTEEKGEGDICISVHLCLKSSLALSSEFSVRIINMPEAGFLLRKEAYLTQVWRIQKSMVPAPVWIALTV